MNWSIKQNEFSKRYEMTAQDDQGLLSGFSFAPPIGGQLVNLPMNETNWTTEFPRKPGVYWVRNYIFNARDGFMDDPTPGPQIVEISEITLTGNADANRTKLDAEWPGWDSTWSQEDFLSAEWYGPIEPPE